MLSGTNRATWSPAALFSSLTVSMVAMLANGCCTPVYDKFPPSALITPQAISFNSADIGKLPADITTALTGGGGPVSWVVREDSSAPGGGPVLVQESADTNSYRFPLCIYGKVIARDVAVEVKYKAISGKVDEAGASSCATAGTITTSPAPTPSKTTSSSLQDRRRRTSHVEEAPAQVAPGVWHTLRFEARGSQLTITFDGKVVINRQDTTFPSPAKWDSGPRPTASSPLPDSI